MKAPFSRLALAAVVLALGTGCYVTEKPKGGGRVAEKPSGPPPRYYVHCEACNWCKGAYKKAQDAEKVSREHNIKTHDYQRVAYYDQEKCR